MTHVLELATLSSFPRRGGQRRMKTLQRLDPRLLIAARDMQRNSHRVSNARLLVGIANRTDLGLERFFVVSLCRQPIPTQVWFEVRLEKKRPTCRTEMLLTMPRLMTSSASSRGVQ